MKERSVGIIPMQQPNSMTPQQVRLFHLQAGRNWGPFSQSEVAALHSEAPNRRREATQVDLSPYIRLVPADADLNALQTILMPGEE